ncbi:MAG: hypothetical protein WA738_05525, partial [Candidatus Angelobacter sp.]
SKPGSKKESWSAGALACAAHSSMPIVAANKQNTKLQNYNSMISLRCSKKFCDPLPVKERTCSLLYSLANPDFFTRKRFQVDVSRGQSHSLTTTRHPEAEHARAAAGFTRIP